MYIVGHVDDLLCEGSMCDLKWFRDALSKGVECKGEILGMGPGLSPSIKYLGRTIRLTLEGLEVEGDQKCVRQLLKETDLDGCKSVTTPGVKDDGKEDDDGPKMEPEGGPHKKIRRGAAQGNFISMDRPDIAYAAKEVARRVSAPCEHDSVKLKRMVRYIKGHSRLVMKYHWQDY